MPNTEQLLYQTDKSSHRVCSIKKAVLKTKAALKPELKTQSVAYAVFIFNPRAPF